MIDKFFCQALSDRRRKTKTKICVLCFAVALITLRIVSEDFAFNILAIANQNVVKCTR